MHALPFLCNHNVIPAQAGMMVSCRNTYQEKHHDQE